MHRSLGTSVFPTNGSVTRPLPFLLTGFLGIGFPVFHRYYEGAKTSRVPPTRFVSSRHGTAPCVLVFRSRGCQTPRPRAGDLLSRMVPAGDWGAEIHGISHVPREPCCASALLSDPGRIASTKPVQWIDVAPDAMTTKAPTTWPCFEAQSHGVCTHCLRFVPPSLTDLPPRFEQANPYNSLEL